MLHRVFRIADIHASRRKFGDRTTAVRIFETSSSASNIEFATSIEWVELPIGDIGGRYRTARFMHPSDKMLWPLMYPDTSEARKTQAWPISPKLAASCAGFDLRALRQVHDIAKARKQIVHWNRQPT